MQVAARGTAELWLLCSQNGRPRVCSREAKGKDVFDVSQDLWKLITFLDS